VTFDELDFPREMGYTGDRLDDEELEDEEESYIPSRFDRISLHAELLNLAATIVLLGLAVAIVVGGGWIDHVLAFVAASAVAVAALIPLSRLLDRTGSHG
jgi:hypothetical protein